MENSNLDEKALLGLLEKETEVLNKIILFNI